jgi:hypothetical protein
MALRNAEGAGADTFDGLSGGDVMREMGKNVGQEVAMAAIPGGGGGGKAAKELLEKLFGAVKKCFKPAAKNVYKTN